MHGLLRNSDIENQEPTAGKLRSRKAFTVVELMVALSVSGIALLAAYELFGSLKDTGNRQSSQWIADREILSAFAWITEDLMHAIPKALAEQQPLFEGHNIPPESESGYLMRFRSLLVPNQSPVCGARQVHQVVYEMIRQDQGSLLYRTADPILRQGMESANPSRKVILRGLQDIKIEFYDGQMLNTVFSSEEALPHYVKIQLTAHDRVLPLTVTLSCGGTHDVR